MGSWKAGWLAGCPEVHLCLLDQTVSLEALRTRQFRRVHRALPLVLQVHRIFSGLPGAGKLLEHLPVQSRDFVSGLSLPRQQDHGDLALWLFAR